MQLNNALHTAIENQPYDEIETLVCNVLTSDQASLNAYNENLETPISVAIKKNRFDVVRLLLASGADTTIPCTKDKITPLRLAAKLGYNEIFQELASLNTAQFDLYLALDAIKGQNLDILKSIPAEFFKSEYTFLVAAEKEYNYLISFKYLVNHFLQDIIKSFEKSHFLKNYTPLIWTLASGSVEASEVLFSALPEDFNFSAANREGSTALHIACEKGFTSIVAALLTKKINIDAKDYEGSTPLHRAAAKSHSEIIKLLLSAKANVNALNNYEATPLILAVKDRSQSIAMITKSVGCKNLDTIKILLDANANVLHAMTNGSAAFNEALNNKDFKLCELLLDYGAGVYFQVGYWNSHFVHQVNFSNKVIIGGTVDGEKVTKKMRGCENAITNAAELKEALDKNLITNKARILRVMKQLAKTKPELCSIPEIFQLPTSSLVNIVLNFFNKPQNTLLRKEVIECTDSTLTEELIFELNPG